HVAEVHERRPNLGRSEQQQQQRRQQLTSAKKAPRPGDASRVDAQRRWQLATRSLGENGDDWLASRQQRCAEDRENGEVSNRVRNGGGCVDAAWSEAPDRRGDDQDTDAPNPASISAGQEGQREPCDDA